MAKLGTKYCHKEETKRKISEKRKKQIPPMLGKINVPREIRICLICNANFEVRKTSIRKYCSRKCVHLSKKNKTYEDIMGKQKAAQLKEIRKNARLGYKFSEETIEKQRQKAIERIESGNGYCPNFNPNTIPIFKEFKKINNLKNCYFATEPHEWHVKGTIYSLDFIDFDNKLIIEVDEEHHFEKSGEYTNYDIKRQNKINELFPDFKFLHFKEDEMHKMLEKII